MKCQRCDNESTGVLVELCDPCFDAWESEVAANPKGADLAPVDARLKYERAGGTVPDDFDGVVVIRSIPFSLN